MSLIQLSFSNFRRSVKEYAALILALAFSIFIFFNFQNVIYSDSMDVLMTMKKDYIDMIVQAASVVFGVFLFFFIWYATNVFLTQRKKEIGIYTFMGLDNVRIGKMYALEAFFIGMFSLAAGLVFGIGFSKLFQMLLMNLSEISVDIRFSISVKPVAVTAMVFLVIFGMMIAKGYYSIKKSSVLDMLSGARQKEMKPENIWLTLVRVVLGIAVLVTGYVFALKTGNVDSLMYALAAVILVIVGTYLLFGGAIPFFVGRLTAWKNFLYHKERTLWVNNLSYRIRRNYRTYAMVTILMICSVTVLGISIAMKQRYDKMEHFRNTYTYQVMSFDKELDGEEIAAGISQTNEVEYHTEIDYLLLDPSLFHTKYVNVTYGVISYSQLKEAAALAGQKFEYEELEDDEAIKLSHVILMSLAGWGIEDIQISDRTFRVLAADDTPYLGELQSAMSIYVLNDKMYHELEGLGTVFHVYNYHIADPSNVEASKPYLETLAVQDESGQYQVGVNIYPPEDKESAWIRVMYSLCIFMFATLVLAGVSIIFIKLNNDAYEDKERYVILRKIGISREALHRAVRNEIMFTYYCPFVLMAVTSWFSIKALGNVMREELFKVNIYSTLSVLVLFSVVCAVSIRIFSRKVLE